MRKLARNSGWVAATLLAASSLTHGAGGNNFVEVARGLGDAGGPGGSFDAVNPFNGNLAVAIPLGPQFHVGELEYGLQAAYNSRAWDFAVYCTNAPTPQPCVDHAFPVQSNNAGLGWMVSPGELYEPVTRFSSQDFNGFYWWRNHSLRDFLYVTPDGREHVFSCDSTTDANCNSFNALQATQFYSQGYEARMRLVANAIEIDFADGSTHRFEQRNWAPCSKPSDTCWKLVQIRNLAGNTVSIGYSGLTQTITDAFNRRHVVQYSSAPAPIRRDNTDIGVYEHVVDWVEINDHAGSASTTFDFNYGSSSHIVQREFSHQQYAGEQISLDLPVPLLQSIGVPATNDFTFQYNTSGNRGAGVLTGYTTPTRLDVDFGYGVYTIPKPCNFVATTQGNGGIPSFDDYPEFEFSYLWGVATRTLTDPFASAGSSVAGSITYSLVAETDAGTTCGSRPRALRSTENGPGNLRVERWFSTATLDGNGWRAAEFGLPFTRSATATFDGDTVYLSRRVLDCTPGSTSGCSVVSRHYVRFALSEGGGAQQCESGDSPVCVRRHAEPVAEYTTWDSQSKGLSRSSFDGLGNWRTLEEHASGYGASSTLRTTTLTVNSAITTADVAIGSSTITLNSGFFDKIPSINNSWLTRLVTRRERSLTVDGSTSRRVERTCFDGVGLPKGAVTGDGDVQRATWVTRHGDSLVDREYFTTGSSLDPCGTPSGPYHDYVYDGFGRVTSSTLVNGSSSEIEYERAHDAAGRLTSERDASGLTVGYSGHDALGRPQTITRTGQSNVGVAYTAASSSAGSKVRFSNGTRWFERLFDGHGRIYREVLPITTAPSVGVRTITTSTKRDANGNVNEVARAPGGKDTLTYDALGRRATHVHADGTTSTFDYTTDLSIAVGRGGSWTRTEYDAFGREYRTSIGLSSDTSTSPTHCTESLLDAGDREIKSRRSSGACGSNGQERTREYSSGGVLLELDTPEAGRTTFSSFDAFGNPASITNQEFTLRQEFDFAGRLEEISSSGGVLDIVKLTYGNTSLCSRTPSQSTNWCLGRVIKQERFNRYSPAQNAPTYKVEESFDYRNDDGSLSKLTTLIEYPNPAGTLKSRSFVQEYTRNDFGELLDFIYPKQSCTGTCSGDIGPTRTLNHTYENGLLTALTLDATALANVTYTGFGALDEIAFPQPNAKLDLGWHDNNVQLERVSARVGTSELWTTGDYEYTTRGLVQATDPHLPAPNPRNTYGYDLANRLTAATVWSPSNDRYDQTFGYDANDNLTARTTKKNNNTIGEPPPSIGSDNRINASGFIYDNIGRLLSDDCLDYTYDPLNALMQVTSSDPAPECQIEARHLYNATGERVLTMCDDGCEKAEPPPPPPAFTLSIDRDRIAPGQSATLTWSAVQHAENGCTTSGAWSITPGLGGGSHLVSPSAEGSYDYAMTCTGRGGSITHSRRLTVAIPPPLSCSNPPASLAVSVGQTAEMSVTCSGGTVPPTYRWERSTDNAAWTPLSDGGRISGATTNRLRITGALEADAGWYRVQVTPGDAGVPPITSTATRLDVVTGAIIGQVGTAVLNNQTETTVSFGVTYGEVPIVLVQPASKTHAQDYRQVVRIQQVNTSGFSARLRPDRFEPTERVEETVNFIAMRPGLWRLVNGKVVSSVAKYNTGIVGKGLPGGVQRWDQTGYRNNYRFTAAPVLLAQNQQVGITRPGWLEYHKIRLRSINNRRFQAAVEVANYVEIAAGDNQRDQTYWTGYVAIEPGTHNLGAGRTLIAQRTATSFTDVWSRITFPVAIPGTPRFIGNLSSYNETDGAALRYRRLIGSTVTVRAEEDSTTNNGDTHAAEQVAYVASNGSFLITGTPLSCNAPVITQAPQNASVMLGGSTTLSVAASDATTYQWQRNGEPILGAIQTTLALGPVAASDAGSYDVEVGNACASSFSAPATVSIVTGTCVAPTIAQQPASQLNVFAGETFRFDVVAAGTAPYTYQWMYSGAPIVGATAPSLTGVANSGLTGTYSVSVGNACGSVTSNVALLVVTSQTPYLASGPVRVGELVEAEYYDLGGSTVAYQDADPQNQGSTTFRANEGVDTWEINPTWRGVGWTAPNEWTEYTIGAATAVPHVVDVMHAADWGQSGSSRTRFGPESSLSEVALAETGGWDAFQVSTSSATIGIGTAPRQVLRMAQVDGAINIDWLRVRPAVPADRATVRVRDLFGGTGVGTALHGRVAAPGYVWSATAATFTDRRSISAGTGTSPVATVPHAPGANKAAVVEAQVKPVGSGWLGVGFANHPTNTWSSGAGQVWAYLTPGNRFAVYAGGLAHPLTGGERNVPAEARYAATRYNQLRLTYDPSLRQARLYVNGVGVTEALTVPAGFTPQLSAAGVAGSNVTSATSMIDTFQLAEYDAGCDAPLIVTQPNPASANVGSPLTLSALVQGATTYQWRRNGTLVANATASTLQINPATPADAGTYDLTAANACGAVQTRSVQATVVCTMPTFVTQPQDQMEAVVGSNVSFSASVTGAAPISYRWLRNGAVVPGAASALLQINSVERSDASQIVLEASNVCGVTLSRSATLRPVSRVPAYPDCRYSDFCLYINGSKVVTALEGRVPGLQTLDFGWIDTNASALVPGVLVYNEFADGSAMPTQELFTNTPFQIRLAGAPIGSAFVLPPADPQEMALEFVPTVPGTFERDVGMIIGLGGQQISIPVRGRACSSACVSIGTREPGNGELLHAPAIGATSTTPIRITPLSGLGGTLTVSAQPVAAMPALGATYTVAGSACQAGVSTPTRCVLSLDGVVETTVNVVVTLPGGVQAAQNALQVRLEHEEFTRTFALFASNCTTGTCVMHRGLRALPGAVLDFGAYRDTDPLGESVWVVTAGSTAIGLEQSVIAAPWTLTRSSSSVAGGLVATLTVGGAVPFGDTTRAFSVAGGGVTHWTGSAKVLGVRYVPIGLPGRMFFVRIPR